jgi:hypothetical protein
MLLRRTLRAGALAACVLLGALPALAGEVRVEGLPPSAAEALAKELRPVLAPAEGKPPREGDARVTLEPGGKTARVRFTPTEGAPVERVVAVEAAPAARARTLRWLLENMVRDEAAELLDGLVPPRSVAPEQDPTAQPSDATAEADLGPAVFPSLPPPSTPPPAQPPSFCDLPRPSFPVGVGLFGPLRLPLPLTRVNAALDLGYGDLGAVQGASVGAFTRVRCDVDGALFTFGAGWAGRDLNGAGVAAGFNFVGRDARGGLLAHGGNLVGRDFAGAAYAPGFNAVVRDADGALGAVGINVVGRNQRGAAGAVGLNLVLGDARGVLISVGANAVGGELEGASLSFVNVSVGNVRGLQLGLGNLGTHQVEGAQVGLVNASQSVEGAQIGLVNFGGKLRGTQIGLINVAEDADAAFGLISISWLRRVRPYVWASNLKPLQAGILFEGKRVFSGVSLGRIAESIINRELIVGFELGLHVVRNDDAGFIWDFVLGVDGGFNDRGTGLFDVGRFGTRVGYRVAKRFAPFMYAGTGLYAENEDGDHLQIRPDFGGGVLF